MKHKRFTITFTSIILAFFLLYTFNKTLLKPVLCDAMPFYDLKPQELVLRSTFCTTYQNSSNERINNIRLASKSLNLTLVDVGGEFSFNRTVGERTEKRGYKKAKIIVNGEFVDGVGGGVCQVSSTLYNAVLLGGIDIIEHHPHSLQVGYVPPSFDAMVNSGFADLRFINNTHNPLIIVSTATNSKLTIEIYGEPTDISYERKSVIVGDIPAPNEDVLLDSDGMYPNLFLGDKLIVRPSKAGLKSEGYVIAKKDGKILYTNKIRSDSYAPTKGLIIIGTAERNLFPLDA